MKQRTVGLTVLSVTISVVVLVISSFIYARDNSTKVYYWCWIWLLPMAVWCWVVTAWCDFQLFKNAKPVGY
ncbi:Eri1p PWA37_002282 [Arxiozyma heterogenica]|uniref:Eri1p n=1 Tax=Arxiozyma heterogenica TaxID=278026 RepID=UPI002F19D408